MNLEEPWTSIPAELLPCTTSCSGFTLYGCVLIKTTCLYIRACLLCRGCICITSPVSLGPPHPFSPWVITSLFLYNFYLVIHLRFFLSLTCSSLVPISRLWPKDLTLQLWQPNSAVHHLLFKFSILWPNSVSAVKTNFPKPHLACVTLLLKIKHWLSVASLKYTHACTHNFCGYYKSNSCLMC